MEEVKVRELPETDTVESSDYMIIEDEDGTKKSLVKNFRSLLLVSLFFDNVQDMKEISNLKEGDICMTLGYYKPGDGGGSLYRITYNPAAVEDRMLVHYLSYSDTLRAEMILTEDSVNVHQFGAKGDGQTDDTAAIQGAFDKCPSKVIKFNNGQRYITRKPIFCSSDHVTVDGNNCIIFPHYCDGITISPNNQNRNYELYNITIKNVIFDLSKANNGIKIENSYNVLIESCIFESISSIGICTDDHINATINKCIFNSIANVNTSAILLDNNEDNQVTSRDICIRDSKMIATKGVHLLSGTDTKDVIIIDGLDFRGKSKSGSLTYGVYVADSFDSLFMNSFVVSDSDVAIYVGGAASKGQVVCNGLFTAHTDYQFEIGSNSVDLTVNNVKAKTGKMFKLMSGKLISNINWDAMKVKATYDNFIGELCDSVAPQTYLGTGSYSISGSTLTIKEARNIHADWSSSTANLSVINGGVKGQLLFIKSSTNKSIINSANKIHLAASSIQLGAYKGILLRYDGVKWVQLQ